MKFLGGSHILLLSVLLFKVSSAPVQEQEVKPSKRHHLNTDKELLLEKIKDLENELEGRRSSQVPRDDNPGVVAEPREKEVGGASTKDKNLVASLLRKGLKDEANQEGVDFGKKALTHFLDNELESGEFVDRPFNEAMLGQIPGNKQKEEDDLSKKEGNEIDKNDMMAMLDSISVNDLKKLLSAFKQDKRGLDNNDMMAMLDNLSIAELKQLLSMFRQNKRAYNSGDVDTDGEDVNDGDINEGQDGDGDGEVGGDDGDEDKDGDGFLQGISVQELKELTEMIKQKKQDGSVTAGDLGKVVYYLVTHLTTKDLQTMLDAAKDQEEEEEDKDEMTDEEIGQAIQDLVSHIGTEQLQSLAAAVRARKQELEDISEESLESSSSSENGLDDRELYQTEEDVMQALMDFLAGLSTEDLKKTILAVKRKKIATKQAVGVTAGEYIQGNDNIDNDNDVTNDGNNDDDTSDKLGPCTQEKQDILDKIEAARLANSHQLSGDVPNCDEDGFYAPKQCSGSMCYCVDKHGTFTQGEAMIWEATSLVCSQGNAVTSSDGSSEEDPSSSISEDDKGDNDDEKAKLEQVERDLLEMLKEQKRQQLSKNEGLNM